MRVLVQIKRFDPDRDRKPYWAEYPVEADPIDRLLDAGLSQPQVFLDCFSAGTAAPVSHRRDHCRARPQKRVEDPIVLPGQR